MSDKQGWSSFFYGVAGAVAAGVLLWGIKSIFPELWAWIATPSVPSGAIMAFDVRSCDEVDGWGDFDEVAGRFILGQTSARSEWRFGERGGEAEHQLTIAEMPTHSHLFRRMEHVGGGCGDHGCNGHVEWREDNTRSAGEDLPHNNMPPYIALTYCKKT